MDIFKRINDSFKAVDYILIVIVLERSWPDLSTHAASMHFLRIDVVGLFSYGLNKNYL